MQRIPAQEREELRTALVDMVAGLDDLGSFEDPWAVESSALGLVPVLPHPDTHPDLAQMVADAYLDRGDELAAAMLIALARLAHDPVASAAREAAAALSRRGVTSPLEEDIGALRARECTIFEVDGELAAIGIMMQRTASPLIAQRALVLIDRDSEATWLREVEVWDPEPLGEVQRLLALDAEEATRRPATPEHVLELVAEGMQPQMPLLDEQLLALAILERALTGEDIHLPWPPAYPADEEENESGFAERLVAQMQAEGVDPTDPAALAAWMDDYNSRSYDERVAITGPAKRSPTRKSKAKRQQAKAARKRNRRR